MTRGRITIHYGGELWRPLVAARAYIACLDADADKVRGQIFNVIFRNLRISELARISALALRVQTALAEQEQLSALSPAELEHPRHYNNRWLTLFEEAEGLLHANGALWGVNRPTGAVRPLRPA